MWTNSNCPVRNRHDPYGHVADWTSTADAITKTFIHDNDDDGHWESGTIGKSYHMSDSGGCCSSIAGKATKKKTSLSVTLAYKTLSRRIRPCWARGST